MKIAFVVITLFITQVSYSQTWQPVEVDDYVNVELPSEPETKTNEEITGYIARYGTSTAIAQSHALPETAKVNDAETLAVALDGYIQAAISKLSPEIKDRHRVYAHRLMLYDMTFVSKDGKINGIWRSFTFRKNIYSVYAFGPDTTEVRKIFDHMSDNLKISDDISFTDQYTFHVEPTPERETETTVADLVGI